MKNIINCTPHDVCLIKKDGTKEVFKASGIVPRINMEIVNTDDEMFVKKVVGDVEGLLEQKENTMYIVSAMVFDSSDRGDLIAPNTNNAIRNELGHIVGVPNFIVK